MQSSLLGWRTRLATTWQDSQSARLPRVRECAATDLRKYSQEEILRRDRAPFLAVHRHASRKVRARTAVSAANSLRLALPQPEGAAQTASARVERPSCK